MRIRSFLLSLGVSLLFATAAAADGPSPLQPGEYGFFFDPGGTETMQAVPLFTPFTLYAVARVPAGGMEAWILPDGLALDPSPVQVNAVAGPGGGMLEVLVFDSCDVARSDDPSTCPFSEGELVVLFTMQMMRVATDVQVCPEGVVCPLFSGPATVPLSYAPCGTLETNPGWIMGPDELLPYAGNCFAFETVVATEAWSAGMWKASW